MHRCRVRVSGARKNVSAERVSSMSSVAMSTPRRMGKSFAAAGILRADVTSLGIYSRPQSRAVPARRSPPRPPHARPPSPLDFGPPWTASSPLTRGRSPLARSIAPLMQFSAEKFTTFAGRPATRDRPDTLRRFRDSLRLGRARERRTVRQEKPATRTNTQRKSLCLSASSTSRSMGLRDVAFDQPQKRPFFQLHDSDVTLPDGANRQPA